MDCHHSKKEKRDDAIALVVAENANGPTRHVLHPFMVEVILKTLFRYLDFESLSRCRLVCKQWYRLSNLQWLNLNRFTNFWSRHITVDLRYENLQNFLQLFNNEEHTYDDYEYAGLRQLKKFRLCDLDTPDQLQVLSLFYQMYGECITSLYISFEFSNLKTYEAILLSKFTPNVKTFVVRSQSYETIDWNPEAISNNLGVHDKLRSLTIIADDNDQIAFPSKSWFAIFRRYSKLVTLGYIMNHDQHKVKLNHMIEGACRVRNDGSGLQKLAAFNISNDTADINETTSLQLKFIRETSIKLHTLGVCLGGQNQCDIWNLLRSQENTLQILILQNSDMTFQHFETPCMPHIYTLQIVGTPFSRIEFLKGFKNLQNLIINDEYGDSDEALDLCCDIDLNKLERNIVPRYSLKKFHFLQYPHGDSSTVIAIRKLQKCFPNLTDLQMYLSNDTFREVCKGWPSIEHLEITGHLVDDEGVTGLLASGELVEPTIASLKDLMSFKYNTLYFNKADLPQSFTESSISNGLLKLRNLQSIELSFSVQLSASVMGQLLQRNIAWKAGRPKAEDFD